MVTPAQSSQSIQPSMPPATSSNDANFSRIATIAIPIITALVSFLVLSAQAAMVITAVVTIVSVAYSMRTEKQPPQPAAAIEPSTVVADPSRPKEIMFTSVNSNEMFDIDKAEYMTVIFKTKEIAEQFAKNHAQKFGSVVRNLSGNQTDVKISPRPKQSLQDAVNTLTAIYNHEGSASQLCPISFVRYQK